MTLERGFVVRATTTTAAGAVTRELIGGFEAQIEGASANDGSTPSEASTIAIGQAATQH
jgi:hypothetical protein